MKKLGETQLLGGTGENPKNPGNINKDFKQMFLEIIAQSKNPQERLMASQMLKNVGFEINPDEKEKAEIVLEQIAEAQEIRKQKIPDLIASEAQATEEARVKMAELRNKISKPEPVEVKNPVYYSPAPKPGQRPTTPSK